MEIEKVTPLNLDGVNMSSKDVEDILGGASIDEGYEIPDVSCVGLSGTCKDGCRSGCKDSQKEGPCDPSCSSGCSQSCHDGCQAGCKKSNKEGK